MLVVNRASYFRGGATMEIEGTLVGTNRHWGIGGKVGAVVLCFPIADMDDLLLMKPGRRVRLVIEDLL